MANHQLARSVLELAQTDNASQPAGVNIHVDVRKYVSDNASYVELLLGIMEQAKDFGFEWSAALPDLIVLVKI